MNERPFVKIITDIVDLERANMTGILKEQGIAFDEEFIAKDIAFYNPHLTYVFCSYSTKGVLQGYFRFNKDAENNIIIRSVQLLQNKTKFQVLKHFLYIGYQHLKLLMNVADVYAYVNIKNTKSHHLVKKLNFKYVSSTRDAVKYSILRDELIVKFEELGMNMLFTQKTHPGRFPIRVLRHNLPLALVMQKPNKEEKLRKAISENIVNPRIEVLIQMEFGLISVDGITKTITINEQFLAFLSG